MPDHCGIFGNKVSFNQARSGLALETISEVKCIRPPMEFFFEIIKENFDSLVNHA